MKPGLELISPKRSLPALVQFHHSPDPKNQDQSLGGEVHFSQVAVGIAAVTDYETGPQLFDAKSV